jgi:hypothetical protein
MKKMMTAALVAMLTINAFPQQKKGKPISHYMRSVGILYLEKIDRFEKACTDLDGIDTCMDRWDDTFEPINSRVQLTMDEGDRPAGDKPFWDTLQTTANAYHITWSSLWMAIKTKNPVKEKEAMERAGKFQDVGMTCRREAKEQIHTGYFANDVCDAAVKKSLEK